jgi:putative hydrolase of the HAD superfamily
MGDYHVDAILFDFGGVLADEGFRQGMHAIALSNRLDPEGFEKMAHDVIHSTGYLIGKADEDTFWQVLRDKAGIKGRDQKFKDMILERFTLRDWIIALVMRLRSHHIRLAILSDQTNWLDEFDAQHHIFQLFDHVFNSFHMGKCKRDLSLFDDVLRIMKVEPGKALFVDDTPGHIERAKARGLSTILYRDKKNFLGNMARFCPGLIHID